MRVIDDINRGLLEKDYGDVRSAFLAECARQGIDRNDVGFFGTVTAPGISDLDVAVIGSADQLRGVQASLEVLSLQEPRVAYAFWHSPVYVLENLQPMVRRLHTFEDLEPHLANRFPASEPGTDDLLRHVWYTFLLGTVAQIFRRRSVSLRLVLLLYKNIEVSKEWLGSGIGSAPSFAVPSSAALRQLVMNREASEVWRTMLRSLSESWEWHDRLGMVFPWPNQTESAGIYQHPGIRIHPGARTRIRRYPNRSVLNLKPCCFALVSRFVHGPIGDDILSSYIRTARSVHSEYRAAGVPYQFVTPASLPFV